jgi:hypothetical protein
MLPNLLFPGLILIMFSPLVCPDNILGFSLVNITMNKVCCDPYSGDTHIQERTNDLKSGTRIYTSNIHSDTLEM